MSRVEHSSERTGLEIAVVGIAARFPGASNIDEFWQNLHDGVETVRFFSDSEWQTFGRDAALVNNPRHVKAEAAIDGIELFDATFFGLSTKDAQLMDPQHRLFLECAYTAIENAGYNTEHLTFPVGVYAGAGINKYLLFNILPSLADAEQMDLFRAMLSNSSSALSTRVSYELNLSGPSLTIQTACSTSLVAIHQACQDLLNYRCDMALAGGVSLNPAQKQGYYYIEEGPISSDGHCRTFDANASGTISGDGVGIVVLRRLEDAIAAGDHIRAVIKGSAVNNDGSAKVGFMAPSVQGQANVISTALTLADVSAETISYIEAHGTATPVGDPIEITALQKAFSAYTDRKGFCAIGSVKTNIGHTDAAAGVAGFIKTVLALEHRQLPPSLHFEQPNPHIDFANSPFYVNTKLADWRSSSGPRRAGVSAFGIGGTNAHVILEEALIAEDTLTARSWQLLTLSAKTETALEAATMQLIDHLRHSDNSNLADIAYTLQVGRREFRYRRTAVCNSSSSAIQALETLVEQALFSSAEDFQMREIAFLFPGGGAQYAAMGFELYQKETVFRQNVDLCADILLPSLNIDIRNILYQDGFSTEIAPSVLKKPSLLLTTTFIIEYALAQLWMSLGVQPQVMIGHSLGEYTAACLAGVMSLPDALALIALRGQLYERITNGATVIVSLSEQDMLSFLNEELSLAAINGPSSCVVSGLVDVVTAMEQQLQKSGVSFRRLQADGAAHSSLLDPYLEEFQRAVRSVELRAPTIPFVSNLTGKWITTEEATDPAYWTRHLRQTVRFADGLALLFQIPDVILLEVGPGQTMRKLVANHPAKSSTCLIFSSMRHPHDPQSDIALWLDTVGQLWSAGIAINWQGLYANESRSRIPLPTYPFERQYYWIEPEAKRLYSSSELQESEMSSLPTTFYTTSWKRALTPLPHTSPIREKPWLVFAQEDEQSSVILKTLEQTDQWLIKVTHGEKFQKITDSHYTLRPLQHRDYISLYQELTHSNALPETVICLWDATSTATSFIPGKDQSFEETITGAFSCLYCFSRAFAAEAFTNSFHFWLCSTGLYDVIGTETVIPARALASGLCEAIVHRYKNITCHVIDLDIAGEGPTKSAQHLLEEVLCCSTEQSVAYRNNHRWLLLSEPVAIDRDAPMLAPIHSDGCYLITNGLSETGYRLAVYLTQLAKVKLVLVDHESLPSRSEWGQWLDATYEIVQNVHGTTFEQLKVDLASEYHYIQRLEEKIEAEQGGGSLPPDLAEGLTTLGALYICNYFRNNGIAIERGMWYSRKTLREKLKIIPKFDKFFETFLALLEVEAIIAIHNENIEFLKNASELEEASGVKTRLETAHPDFSAYLSLLEYIVQYYDQALSGEIETANILFPDGTYSLLQPVADQSMKFSYANVYPRIVAEIVAHIVQVARKKEKIRILEVGAGQGYLTWLVISKLQGLANVEYFFTDIAKSFVMKAEKHAWQENLDWMRFGTMDVAHDPANQGYDKYSFDIVLEYDVIHATKDISGALQNIKKLLAPNGIFLSVQAPSVRWTSTLIWGFAEGWWNFAEDALRKDNLTAVLNYENWEKILWIHEYQNIRIYPQDEEKRSIVDRMLIVAQQQSEIDTEDYKTWDKENRKERISFQQSRIQKIQALEKSGAEVLVVEPDDTEQAQLQRAVTSAQKCFGSIRGVFHITAPATGRKAEDIRTMPLSELTSNLRLSIQDAIALAEILHGDPLDFALWMLSDEDKDEIHGVTPILWSFINAFITNKRVLGAHFWKSMQWDLERSLLTKASVVDQTDSDKQRKEIISYLLSRYDISCLKAYSSPLYTANLRSAKVRAQPSAEVVMPVTGISNEGHRSPPRRPNLRHAYIPPGNETEQIIANLWENLLGGIEVGINDNFFELGGESLLATQFISKLRDLFHIDIPIRTFFENATIAAVSRAISEAKEADTKLQEPEILALPRARKRIR